MDTDLERAMVDAIYRSVTEPQAWDEVVSLAARAWPSNAQTFYFLERPDRRVRPGTLAGIAPAWLERFDACYFAPDNPWIRLTERLHRPGIVRTNERLARLTGDPDALYRSAYFNDWLRPQGFRWSLGTTLIADDGLVANVTLLRPPDMPTFDDGEVAAFERIAGHMTRAMELAARLDVAGSDAAVESALDALRHPVALLDVKLRIVYANDAMQSLLRRACGLRTHGERLGAVDPRTHRALRALVADAIEPVRAAGAGVAEDAFLAVQRDGRSPLVLRAAPARGGAGRYLRPRPLALLLVADPDGAPPLPIDALRRLYGFTRAEARLAAALVGGATLREAAAALGVRYESARTTLKAVFAKADVASQARLVARILRDLPP